MTLEENQNRIIARYKARQVEISKGIDRVISEVFNVETQGGAVLSEAVLIKRFSDRWYECIRDYLISIDNDLGLDPAAFVPTVTGINYHCGSVDVKPSPAHAKLAIGEYIVGMPFRGCITQYLQAVDKLTTGMAAASKKGDVIYEPPTPQPAVIEEGDTALCLNTGDVFEQVDGGFIKKDHLSPDSFGVRDGWYGRTDSNGIWIPLGPMKDMRGEVRPVEKVAVDDLEMVPWSWVETHPDELCIGMIAFPNDTGIAAGSNISIYMGDGKWQSVQVKK